MHAIRYSHFVVSGLAVLALTGCASTARMQYGQLPTGAPMVELVVTIDRKVVEQECDMDPALTLGRPVYGCRIQKRVPGIDAYVRSVKVVRWTDAMPGDMAVEVEIHELCHTVAGLQPINDPCHVGNHGMAMARNIRRGRRARRKAEDDSYFDDGVEMPVPPEQVPCGETRR